MVNSLPLQKDFQNLKQQNATIDEMKTFAAEKLPKGREEMPLVSATSYMHTAEANDSEVLAGAFGVA